MKALQKTQLVRNILAATALLGSVFGSTQASAALNPANTSVQMFRWKWNDIAKECTNHLGPQGFGGVQISPPHASAMLNYWYDVYQPVNYTVLNSRMGTEAELQSMINTCHAAGVRVYADVVVNQMAADSGTATDGSTWNAGTLTYPFFSSYDFHPYCVINDKVDYGASGSRTNVTQCRLLNMPDLNTGSSYVQGQIRNYINKLVGMGIDGVRIDAAKHIAANELATIMGSVNRTTRMGENLWVTQEIIPDDNVNRNEYLSIGTINEFKFTYMVRDMFRNTHGSTLSQVRSYIGVPGNWGGAWGFLQSDQATVFVNNWDSERHVDDSLNASNYTGVTNDTQGTKRYDLANIFMLAWPYGHAQLHSGFRFTWSDQPPPSASPFDANGNPLINQSWDFIHRWSDISNMVAFRNYTSDTGVDQFVSGTSNQIAFARGTKGFVAINNDTGAWNATFQTKLPAGTYCNVVHGKLNATRTACTSDSVVVNASGVATVSIPGNGGSIVPAVALQADQSIGGCSANVKFRVANANTVYGQNVYVVGNQPALGNWTPTSSDILNIEASGANSAWSKTIQLPANTPIQFKFMKHGAVADVWESNQPTASGNREVTTPACGTSLTLDVGSFKF